MNKYLINLVGLSVLSANLLADDWTTDKKIVPMEIQELYYSSQGTKKTNTSDNKNISSVDKSNNIGITVGYEKSFGSGSRTTEYSQARSSGYSVYTYEDEWDSDVEQDMGLFKIGYISDVDRASFYSVTLKVGKASIETSYPNGYVDDIDADVIGIDYTHYFKQDYSNGGFGLKVEIDSITYDFSQEEAEYYGQSSYSAISFVWGVNYFYLYNNWIGSIGVDYRVNLWEVTGGVDDYTTYLERDSSLMSTINIAYNF